MKKTLSLLLVLALLALTPAVGVRALGPRESDVFYPQLSGAAQRIYDALCSPSVFRRFSAGETVTLNLYRPFENPDHPEDEILEGCRRAIAAIEFNYPELFWLDSGDASVSGDDIVQTLTIRPTFAVNWDKANGGKRSMDDDAALLETAVKELAAEAAAQGDRYAQLLFLHDWLTTHNTYNRLAAVQGHRHDFLPWTPLAALTDLSQPVCEGYAKAFKLVCDELGIPCMMVDGVTEVAHEWNQVWLDGAWYAVDVTWDDPVVRTGAAAGDASGRETRDFFLVGTDTAPAGNVPFSESHIPDGARFDGVTFDYPALSETAYDPERAVQPEEPAPMVFADVPGDAYYAAAVDWAVQLGVTRGMGKDAAGQDYFAPGDPVTRGQAAAFLWNALGKPEPDTSDSPFSDVGAADYYRAAVLWAVENGVVTGRDAAHFCPGDRVTRGEMITLLWRALGRPGETEDYDGKPWYADAERWGSGLGISERADEADFRQDDCPRCDVVYYLYRALA